MKEYKILVNDYIVMVTKSLREALAKMQLYGASVFDTVKVIDENHHVCAKKRIHSGFKNYSLYLNEEQVAGRLTLTQADQAADELLKCSKYAEVRVTNPTTGYEKIYREGVL